MDVQTALWECLCFLRGQSVIGTRLSERRDSGPHVDDRFLDYKVSSLSRPGSLRNRTSHSFAVSVVLKKLLFVHEKRTGQVKEGLANICTKERESGHISFLCLVSFSSLASGRYCSFAMLC